jgi:hypothetical protein
MWIDQLQSRLREHKRLEEHDIEESLVQALNEYNGYYPAVMNYVIESSGVQILDLPDTWVSKFSAISKLEYPLAEDLLIDNPSGYPIPAIHEESDYCIQIIGEEEKLIVLFDFPTGTNLRIYYMTPYTVDNCESIPYHHQGAILNLATSYALAKLAAVYSQSVKYEVQADTVDYRSRISEYLGQASWYRDKWEQVMLLGKYATDTTVRTEYGVDQVQIGIIKERTYVVDRTHRLFHPSYEQ